MTGLALQEIFIRCGMDGKPFFKGLKDLNKKTRGVFKSLAKFAGIAGFAKMAYDAQKLGRELGLIADKTGIAASKIGKMQSAFAATGGDAKTIGNVLTGITSGLAKLSMGDATMASRLSAMNISAWDEGGNVKKADVVLGEIADWTKGQIDAGRSMVEVAQFLQDNFNIPQELANQLALGQEGFAKYQEAITERVGSLNEKEISNLQSLNTSLSRLKETVIILVEKITAGLGPAIEFFTDIFQIAAKELQDVFGYLVQSFQDIVGSGEELYILFDFLKNVVKALGLVLKGIIDVFKGLFQAVKMIGEVIGEGIAAIVDWFQNSWLGKKILSGNGSSDEDKKKSNKKIESWWDDSEYKKPFPTIFGGDVGSSVDLSQVSSVNNSGTFKIEFENDITVNASGTEEATIAKAISDVQMRNYNNMKDYFRQNVPALADGGI